MTSSELLAALSLPSAARAALVSVLDPSDLVKFADHVPDASERTRVLDAAESFVLATRTSP